jgi:hypothetical protein
MIPEAMIPEQSRSGVPGEQDAHPINRSNKFAIPYIVKDLPQTRHHRGGFMPDWTSETV